MARKIPIAIFLLLLLVFTIGCAQETSDDSSPDITPEETTTDSSSGTSSASVIQGFALDGPCKSAGSTVDIVQLDNTTGLPVSGLEYSTNILNDTGYYELPPEIDASVYPIAKIQVSASCFSEILKVYLSNKTYKVAVDLTETGLKNATPQTTGVYDRIIELWTNPSSPTYQDFRASRDQAESEWLTLYKLPFVTGAFSKMTLADQGEANAALLIMNSIQLYGFTEVTSQQYTQDLSDEIRFDGVSTNTTLNNYITTAYQDIPWMMVKKNTEYIYDQLGVVANIPKFWKINDVNQNGIRDELEPTVIPVYLYERTPKVIGTWNYWGVGAGGGTKPLAKFFAWPYEGSSSFKPNFLAMQATCDKFSIYTDNSGQPGTPIKTVDKAKFDYLVNNDYYDASNNAYQHIPSRCLVFLNKEVDFNGRLWVVSHSDTAFRPDTAQDGTVPFSERKYSTDGTTWNTWTDIGGQGANEIATRIIFFD